MQNSGPTGELLSRVLKNLRRTTDDLCSVIPGIEDRFLLTDVTAQIEKYSELTRRTEDMMRSRSLSPREMTLPEKLAARGAVAVSTMLDRSDGNIARVISKGAKNGARRLGEDMERCFLDGCDARSLALCRDVIEYELDSAERMKDFTG